MLICFNSTIFIHIGNLHYNHLYILLFKGAIYLISILQQVCICFHGNGKKEVNLKHVLQSIELGGPYQELAVCKYAIVPTTIGKTCLKITKFSFWLYIWLPHPLLKSINVTISNLTYLFCWNHIDNVNISQQNYLLNILKLELYPTGNI